MTIVQPDEVPALIGEWPENQSTAPARDDECARLETVRLAEWWLGLQPPGFTASVTAGPTVSNPPKGWHALYELAHPRFAKPCRCFRVLVQHWKPPRVYQLQFPMEARELPGTGALGEEVAGLVERAHGWAVASNLRDTAANKNIKSIDLYRQFSEVQFARFTDLVGRFVAELRDILDRHAAEGAA